MKEENKKSINTISKTDKKSLIQMSFDEPKQINIQDKSKKDILRVLIYIYYYEKDVLNVTKGINFNEKEKYYLIKSTWINELKNYYEYQNISKSLDKFRLISKNRNNIPINLNRLSDNNLLENIKLYLNKFKVYLLNKQSNENLIDSNINIKPIRKKKNFICYSNCYIINSKILEIFENYILEGQKIKVKPIFIFNKENYIFLPFYDKNVFVTIGSLNNNFLFQSISCICFRNPIIFENEKDELLNKSFKDYIISRKCQENDPNIQNLIKEINNKFCMIGQVLMINLIPLNSNFNINKRATSPKPGVKILFEKNIEKSNIYTLNNYDQSLKKNIVENNLNRRSQTPSNIVKSQYDLNNNILKNNTTFSIIKKKIPYKNKNNQKQIKALIPSNNDREKEKNEKNKNMLIEKEVKIDEFEKEVPSLKSLLNKQSENEFEIEILNNEYNKLKIENLDKDIQIKMLKVDIDNKIKKKENELTSKINENIGLQRNNEELKKELDNLQNTLMKLKKEYQIRMEEKEIEIKKIKLDLVHKGSQNLRIIENESQNIINSMIDELEYQKNDYNKLKEKEIEEAKKILQLQSQLTEKDEKIKNILNEKDVKIYELEKEIFKLKILMVDIDNKNKQEDKELTKKLKENIEFQRNNEELKKS